MLKGVAQVGIFGAQKFAVRIDVDPRQLAARGLGIDQVATAVSRGSVEPADRHAVRTGPDVRREDRRPAHERRGVPAADRRVSRTAGRSGSMKSRNVYDGVENDKTASWYNGSRTIYLADQTASRARTRSKSSTRSGRCCRSSRRSCRPSLSLAVRSDRSQSIRESVHDIKLTLVLTSRSSCS